MVFFEIWEKCLNTEAILISAITTNSSLCNQHGLVINKIISLGTARQINSEDGQKMYNRLYLAWP